MDYYFGDGAGQPEYWQGTADLTLGGGLADAISVDFDGDGWRDDAMWDRDADGVADFAVIDHGTGSQQLYSDASGSGVWADRVDGSAVQPAPHGLEPAESGMDSTGLAGKINPDRFSDSTSGLLSAPTSLGAASLITGVAAPEVSSVAESANWGAVLADAISAVDGGGAGGELARWDMPAVTESASDGQAGPLTHEGPPRAPAPASGSELPGGLGLAQAGIAIDDHATTPRVETDGSISVQTGQGMMSVTDDNGDGTLDAVRPLPDSSENATGDASRAHNGTDSVTPAVSAASDRPDREFASGSLSAAAGTGGDVDAALSDTVTAPPREQAGILGGIDSAQTPSRPR